MTEKSQFQNLVLQQTLQEHSQQPSFTFQPAITLPIRPETFVARPPTVSSFSGPSPVSGPGDEITLRSMGELAPATPVVAEIPSIPTTPEIPGTTEMQEGVNQAEADLSGAALPSLVVPASRRGKKLFLRGAAVLLGILLLLALYLTWHAATPLAASPTITQPVYSSPGGAPRSSLVGTPTSAVSSDGPIQVYITGAIRRSGVYTLPANARVYQLIQAAGGVLPNADLVSLNLAAGLTDGQEIYVLSVGETPPASVGNPSTIGDNTGGTPSGAIGLPVNINTATEAEMKLALHVSSVTAQKIIAYRTQHGRYTSVDQLLQVVSKSIYDRIKNKVTV